MLNDLLLKEVAHLRELGRGPEVVEAEGVINLIFPDYPVPPNYSKSRTTLLVRLPLSYPNGSPDMFWTESDLVCVGGKIPDKADVSEIHMGRQWRRFSWHPQNWNPGSGNLLMYLEFVNQGLIRAREHCN